MHMNTTRPPTKTCLRPTMSARRPMGISITLVLSTYPSVIHWTVGMSTSK